MQTNSLYGKNVLLAYRALDCDVTHVTNVKKVLWNLMVSYPWQLITCLCRRHGNPHNNKGGKRETKEDDLIEKSKREQGLMGTRGDIHSNKIERKKRRQKEKEGERKRRESRRWKRRESGNMERKGKKGGEERR